VSTTPDPSGISEFTPPPFDFRWSMDSGAWLVKRDRWWGRASDDQIRQILTWVNGTHGLNLETPQ
jgi:hypothetical protein